MLVIASGVFTPVVAYMGVGTVEDQLRWRYGPLQSSVGGWHVANSSHNGPWGFEVLPLRIQEGGEAFWVRTVLVGTLVPGLQSVVEVRRVDM